MPFPQDGSKYLFALIKSAFDMFKQIRTGGLKKPKFLITALFILVGVGGVVAATNISINSGAPVSLGAGYATATACDANVTLKANTAFDAGSGQLYLATIALSDISQNATTGCGNKTMEMALKINGQVTFASWDIPASATDGVFYFTGATSSISDYNAMTALSPFKADGLTNIAIAKIGSFNYSNFDWTQRAKQRKWIGVASSNDGTKLVAVDIGTDATGGYIYTSTNSGLSWRESLVPGLRNWGAVASSADGSKLVAVDYPSFDNDPARGYIFTSNDSGNTWTAQTNAGVNWWQSITSSDDGTKIAAVTWGDYIYTSTDSGTNWSTRTGPGQRIWQSIASSADGTKLVATDFGSTDYDGAGGYIYTSINSGATWVARTNAGARHWRSVTSSADGKNLAAVNYPQWDTGATGGYIYTSTDYGVTWTEQRSAGIKWWESITSSSDGTKLAAAANPGNIYTSADSGFTWTRQTTSGERVWANITSSADGLKLVAVDYGTDATAATAGYIYTGLATKTRSSD
jgi:hypothetical protein